MSSSKATLSLMTLILVVLLATSIGSYNISITEVAKVFLNKVGFGFEIESTVDVIIWKIRFPRVLLAFLVGASLSVSGLIIQSLFKNPLASPYTLGVSSGASLGVSLIIMFGLTGVIGSLTISFVAIISSIITILSVLTLARRLDKNLSNLTVVLTGLVVSLFLNAVVTLIMALSREGLESIVRFGMGSLALRGWTYVYIIFVFFVIGVITSYLYKEQLDILTFGEDNAKSLGIDVKRTKTVLIIVAGMLTGVSIAVSGVIGFIGLVVPHLVRRVFGPSHRLTIPFSIVFGGVFLITSDLIARTIISPSELPVGAITAFIGGPFFIYIFFWRKS